MVIYVHLCHLYIHAQTTARHMFLTRLLAQTSPSALSATARVTMRRARATALHSDSARRLVLAKPHATDHVGYHKTESKTTYTEKWRSYQRPNIRSRCQSREVPRQPTSPKPQKKLKAGTRRGAPAKSIEYIY